MKYLRRLFIFSIIIMMVFFILSLPSCDLFGTTIEGRINALVGDLNRDTGRNISDNFHPELDPGGLWNDDTDFNTTELRAAYNFPTEFSIGMDGSPVDVGGQPGQKSQSGHIFSSSPNTGAQINFHFKEDGANNWKIHGMTIQGSAVTWGSL